MDHLLEKLLARPCLQSAQMAGAAVRGLAASDPRRALAGLAAWSEHAEPTVRIAAGVGLGILGMRDRNALPDVLPYVERLADDRDAEVREHGAAAALEQVWLVHTDPVNAVVEEWIRGKNDNVREMAVRTVARIATSGKIGRPSILRRFIERGLALFDGLVPDASTQIRGAVAEAVDEMGCLAPDVVAPVVAAWAGRSDIGSLRMVVELARHPFLATCDGVDVNEVAQRLKALEAKARTRAAKWVRDGVGSLDYLPLFTAEFLEPARDPALPWTHVADPYRGCQLRCEFCNARSLSEWIGDTPETFVRRVSIVRNAPEVLARELADPAMSPRAEHVICVGATSDPYQPAEERFEVTREVLKLCLELEHPVIVQTRQELVLRDLDVLEALADRNLVNVLVAMQTAVDGIRGRIELGTSTVAERYRAMRMLATKHVPVGLVLSPIMPEVTDDEAILEETIRRAADAGAKWVTAQVLDLRGSAGVKVRLFRDSIDTTLGDRYDKLYVGNGGRTADPAYVAKITGEVVPRLAKKHLLDDTSRMLTSGRASAACLARA